MTREQYESLPLSELKEIAKARGLKRTSTMKKGDLIQLMLEKDEENRPQKSVEKAPERPVEKPAEPAKAAPDMSQLDSGQVANGILEVYSLR